MKTKFSKSHKIDIFPKGFAHAFGTKMAIFATFFLGNFSQENVFNAILERANAFLSFKKTEVQKVEKLTFFQRV